jgi:Zn-dependent peptidase ImmA (M78 family)
MSRADAAARGLAEEQENTGLPVDLEKVARNLGGTVVRESSSGPLYGMLVRRDGQLIIGVNSDQPPTAQRFALAHLLGHLKLHRGRDLLIDVPTRYAYDNLVSMPTDREEAEANRFAGALLMPEGAVRRMAREADFDTAEQLVDLLAPRFKVSTPVMGYRLMSLGIVLDI